MARIMFMKIRDILMAVLVGSGAHSTQMDQQCPKSHAVESLN